MAKAAAPKDFESALAELEKIVAQMESGKLGLEVIGVAPLERDWAYTDINKAGQEYGEEWTEEELRAV